MTLTVVQTGDLEASPSIDYATSDKTAEAGADYTSTTGTLQFGPGTNTLTITIPLTDDTSLEANEEFNVTLSNGSGATLLAASNSVVKIRIRSNKRQR